MPVLSSNNQKILLDLARQSIQEYLATGNALQYQTGAEELLQPAGCFVTLRKEGHLRGCVGTFNRKEALVRNLLRMAVASAAQDPRFPPVSKPELDLIRIEISVLGPPEKVNSLEEIMLGKHGIYVKLGARTGTFLPEVAVEQNWSVPEFVMTCAREKAGLGPEEIAHAEIYRYEVQKFKE